MQREEDMRGVDKILRKIKTQKNSRASLTHDSHVQANLLFWFRDVEIITADYSLDIVIAIITFG